MKNIKQSFPWALRPSKDEFSKMWKKDAIFVFDTSFLLGLYQLSDSTREDYFKILDQVKDRIWIPEHVADEFFTNREKVLSSKFSENLSKLNKIKEDVYKLKAALGGKPPAELFDQTYIQNFKERLDNFQTKNNKSLSQIKNNLQNLQNDLFGVELFDQNTNIQEVKDILGEFPTHLKSKIEEIEKSNENYKEKDYILESIDWLFDESKIGKPFKKEDLQELYEKAEKRFQMRIPPGFQDREKPGVKRYGDFLIWQQILNFAKETSQPIILITNDTKEDWWNIYGKNVRISPHIKLRREFYEDTKQKFWMYTTEDFLKYAKEHFNVEVNDNSINETQEIAEEETWENESDSDSDFESGSKRTNIVEHLEFVSLSINRDQNEHFIVRLLQNAEKTLREDEKRQKHSYENL